MVRGTYHFPQADRGFRHGWSRRLRFLGVVENPTDIEISRIAMIVTGSSDPPRAPSATSRIARSRNSFGYFLGAGTTPPFRGFGLSTKPGAIPELLTWWRLGIAFSFVGRGF